MLKHLIRHVAQTAGLNGQTSRAALGILLSASDRQGSPFMKELNQRFPAVRKLVNQSRQVYGGAKGEIAQLIEQTPGGRMAVATTMIRNLQNLGLSHQQIAGLFPAVSSYYETNYGIKGFAHLGDLLGGGEAVEASKAVHG